LVFVQKNQKKGIVDKRRSYSIIEIDFCVALAWFNYDSMRGKVARSSKTHEGFDPNFTEL